MFGKSLTYRLSPLAESDLEEIWLYTAETWSLDQADSYHRAIIKAIEGLASGRNIWQKSNVLDGYWKYRVGKHIVFFRSPDGFLDVIRILHERMDVNQHLAMDMFSEGEN